MACCYKTRTLRGANLIAANPEKLTSADGLRTALGRNVKGEGRTAGTYVGVRVWTLKERVNGKLETRDTYCTEEQARAWIANGNTRQGPIKAVLPVPRRKAVAS